MKMKLTAKALEKLRYKGPLPFLDIKDSLAQGLYLRLFKSDTARWVKRYKRGGKTHVPNLFGDEDARKIGLAKARTKSFAWDAVIRAGRNPAAEERREAAIERRLPTVEAFAAEYIERHAKPNKRSWREDERLLRHDVLPVIGDLRIDIVGRRDVVLFLDAIRDRGAAVVANRALAVTRRMFAFAVERGVIEIDPFAGIRASRETPRARTLSDDELRRLWAATAPASPRIEPPTRLALRLLLLTGARAGEVCGASWGEIHTGTAEWIVPAARTKNGREHRIPLSEPAMEIVQEAAALRQGNWLLPTARGEGHVTIWGALDAVQRILGDSVVAHDLRRSVATGLQRLGIRLEVTEAVLNHVSGSRAGVVGIYQRHDWSAEKRAALDAWARHILAMTAGELGGDNVRELPGGPPEMPRSKRVRRRTIPKVEPVALDQRARREIAQYLYGDKLASLPDDVAAGIAHTLGSHQPKQWQGGTPRRSADALRRVAGFLDRAEIEMRVLTEASDIDDETAELLLNEAKALVAAMHGFRERSLARAATLGAMPPIRPEHEALVQTVGWLRVIFQTIAAPHVRDNDANLRGFIIASLDAHGIDTSNLKEHPDRLRKMLRVKVALPTPDWPRTPAVLA